MAVAPTGAIYKTLTFDGVSSADFGVYITGEAVFNAPQRDVEMVTIPGRNGTFALDNGRFENIEVSYPAGIFADTEADFAEAVSEFRNFLCSRNGYVRLEDDYNASEYRMAVYKSGLEVTPALLKAGEFTLTFDCKPQRWLTSGETAISVDSGDTLTNPTRFESGPLLEVEGFGLIGFNGYEISLEEVPLGTVTVAEPVDSSTNQVYTAELPSSLINEGDPLNVERFRFTMQFRVKKANSYFRGSPTITSTYTKGFASSYSYLGTQGHTTLVVSLRLSNYDELVYGTEASASFGVTISGHTYNASTGLEDYSINASISIALVDNPWRVRARVTYPASPTGVKDATNHRTYIDKVTAESSVSALGHPTYIDCDLGEAYMINDGEIASLNEHVDLGSKLPKLAVGETEFTFDNTITSLDVKPRWWKV